MDTSLEYIKMCQMAEEIKVAWEPDWADFYAYGVYCANKEENEMHIGTVHAWQMNKGEWYGEPIIWLPRQDQLQEMCWGKFRLPCAELKLLYEDIHYVKHPSTALYYWQFTSMEQLWLAFLMREKHRKEWDGEEWVEKGGNL